MLLTYFFLKGKIQNNVRRQFMKKRFLSLILVLFTVFAVSGCSVRGISDTTTAETTTGVIDESTVNVTLDRKSVV